MGLVAPQHVGSSRTRDWTCVPCIGRQILNHCVTREVPCLIFFLKKTNNFIYSWKLKHKILASESVRSLDQMGQQQAGKQTQGPIQIILLKSITPSKGRPDSVFLWTTSLHTVRSPQAAWAYCWGLWEHSQSFSSPEVHQWVFQTPRASH